MPLAAFSLTLSLTRRQRFLSLGPRSSRSLAAVFPPNSLSPFRDVGRDVDRRAVGQAAATVRASRTAVYPSHVRRPRPHRLKIIGFLMKKKNVFKKIVFIMNNVVFSVLYFFFYFRRTVIASVLRISNEMILISAIHPSTGRKRDCRFVSFTPSLAPAYPPDRRARWVPDRDNRCDNAHVRHDVNAIFFTFQIKRVEI